MTIEKQISRRLRTLPQCLGSHNDERPTTDLPYLRMRKNSSADLRGSRNRSDITATESAPAAMTEAAFVRVIPPIATSGLRVKARARRTPSSPTTGSGFSLLESKTLAQWRDSPPRSDRPRAIARDYAWRPQPTIRPNNGAHSLGRQILLPDMHTIKLRCQAQVGAVVHDEPQLWVGHSCPTLPAQFPRLLQHHPSRFRTCCDIESTSRPRTRVPARH